MSADFDWSNEGEVVVPGQSAVAVYRNPRRGYEIRQEDDGLGDQVVVLNDDAAVRSLIRKLQELKRGVA